MPTPTAVIDDVIFIADLDPISATDHMWDAVDNGQEFCVCHDIPTGPAPTVPRDGSFFQTQTGGTTGTPKRIRRSHASWIKSFDQNVSMFGLSPDDTYAILGRLGHSLSLYAAIEATHIGAEIHFLSHCTVTDISDVGVTVIYATPSQLRRFRNGTAPKVRHIFCGGGTLDAATRDTISARFPNADIREFYGASETSFITMSDADTPDGSVGRPYPDVNLDIRATADGIGEIWVQSPYLFTDYADGARALDWVSVGEIGRLTDGYLFISGRRDRMVTIADQNVFPEQIEQAIRDQRGVNDICVIATPDPSRGHVLRAYVVGDVDVDMLRDQLRDRFGSLIAPKTINVVTDLPKTASGKHDLQRIAEWPHDP